MEYLYTILVVYSIVAIAGIIIENDEIKNWFTQNKKSSLERVRRENLILHGKIKDDFVIKLDMFIKYHSCDFVVIYIIKQIENKLYLINIRNSSYYCCAKGIKGEEINFMSDFGYIDNDKFKEIKAEDLFKLEIIKE